ncbi:Mei4-dependent protein 6 [Coprinopsis sp. MPI-PUGE-AT-0042]|nr:Mei4-dependent protein 6 [Coprinopsis sp. MPI-PUGE-AT-0042]
MKEFKISIGTSEDHLVQVLHGGLKNSPEAESFEIRHVNSMGVSVPTRYIKIEPLAAHGASFHVSIWHVALHGQREKLVMRHIMKHLRQCRLLSPVKAIAERSGLHLEHPLVTQIHESIVLEGDWKAAEQALESLADVGLFTGYLHSCQPEAFWQRITGTSGDADVPSPRGGHAMCIDPDNDIIYLFGGWDGKKSLDDFWSYDIREDRWKLLSASTEQEPNAPGPRSCHKMVFDPKTGNIYLLGRLDDTDMKPATSNSGRPTSGNPYPHLPAYLQGHLSSTVAQASPLRQEITPPGGLTSSPEKTYYSEFYRYSTHGLDAGKWVFLSFDTAASGGPPLMHDPQLVIDSEAQILYVHGGRVLDGDWDAPKYSGLYSYDIRRSKWKLLQAADMTGSLPNVIPPRFGHSMVLEPTTKQLYIFGGQREHERYLSDMYIFDIPTNTSTRVYANSAESGGPEPSFTQRAVIDPRFKEFYVFRGLTKSTTGTSQNAYVGGQSIWMYRYSPRPGKWSQIPRHPDYLPSDVPAPRFAHQIVYHPRTQTIFLHGGNGGGIPDKDKDRNVSTSSNPSSNGSTSTNSSISTVTPSSLSQTMFTSSAGGQSSVPTTSNTTGATSGPSRPVPERNLAIDPSVPKMKRLDDFWKMELRRFREMCEEIEPVPALQFLQNEVSSVVDHQNHEESEAFRSLLQYLLSPSSNPSNRSSSQDSSRLAEGSDRQSRRSSDSDSSGEWTNRLPGEDASQDDDEVEGKSEDDTVEGRGDGEDGRASFDYEKRGVANMLRGIVDPLEFRANAGPEGNAKALSLTAERYRQRTEVFSSILEFISKEHKEPEGDLLHMVIGQDALYEGPVLDS